MTIGPFPVSLRVVLRRHPRLTGALVGLAVMTASLAMLFNTEAGRIAEFWTFDARMRFCNNVLPSTPIVHIDIDNSALERVGRWPWHRQHVAEIIRSLHELGAANIFIDLLLSEPESAYLDDPRIGQFGESGDPATALGEFTEENYVYPDLELAAAMREAGNVILGMDARNIRATDGSMAKAELREQMKGLLRKRFTLDEQELAKSLGQPVSEVASIIAGIKTKVAEELVMKLASGKTLPSEESVLTAILGDRKDTQNADRKDVQQAYFTMRGLRAVERSLIRPAAPLGAALHSATELVPPCHRLTDAVATVAAVNFTPDTGGTLRRVPLILKYHDTYVPHMGLAGACRILGLVPEKVTLDGDSTIVIPRSNGDPVRIPLDETGEMVIQWTRTAAHWREGADFRHITAAKLYALVDAKKQLSNNERLRDYKLADVVAVSKGQLKVTTASGPAESVHADHAFRKRVNEQLGIARRAHLARLRADSPPDQIAAMERQAAVLLEEIHRDQRQAIAAVQMTCQEIDEIPPDELAKDPAAMEDAKRYRWARDVINNDIARIDAANKSLTDSIAALRAELAPDIKGKHAFIGYAATAEGDIVPTPIDPRTIGVMCHAHVLNGILQDRFISPAGRRTERGIAILLGAIVSLVTATRGPRLALLATLGLMLAYGLFVCLVLFKLYGVWFALAAPVTTMFITWAFVTLFRQFTAERDKRMFAKQLSQYTSPIIASRIAENPDAVAAFKTVQTRDMTFFFSDLAGFTTISEKENPEVVQHVLNTYLERMSRVIWSHRGLINKFMGDGIMAFFNPSVDPLENHVSIACETCMATIEELDKLKRDFADDKDARIFEQLSMRIGLSTGLCKNGDLGSELKADYTVIGDVVNLAARLEPANKVFGSCIMVSGAVRNLVKEKFEFRYLAELQVKGKAETVPVYELLCRKGALSDEDRTYVERFEAGVELYKQRKWDECIVHFTRILARRFDDVGASRYVDACTEFKRFPPNDDWNGALELKEK